MTRDATTLSLRMGARQTQAISSRLQHAVRLLQMSSLDFATSLRHSVQQNPFLELDDLDDARLDDVHTLGGDDPLPGDAADDGGVEAEAMPGVDPRDALEPPDRRRDAVDGADAGVRRSDGLAASRVDLTASPVQLNDHLRGQLCMLRLTTRDAVLANAVIESLDDDGYLCTPLEALQCAIALRPAPTARELTRALTRVQSLDPAGVGARNVSECLHLQLVCLATSVVRDLALRIVDRHLDVLAARQAGRLARATGHSAAQVEAACACIRRLDPRPGLRIGQADTRAWVPDLSVRRARTADGQSRWLVRLNPSAIPTVRLNRQYADLYDRHRHQGNPTLTRHLQEARWTVRNVEQRASTMVAVSEAIVARQRHFLDLGPMAMRPLGLREISEPVHMHESTVSRMTSNKYIATPNGVFELKYFFSRAMVGAHGRACSATALRSLIGELIAGEPAEAPLSDVEITRLLPRQGLTLARRTVTKYRQLLKLDPVEQRRQHGH